MAKAGRRRGSKGGGWGVPFPKVSRKPGTFSQAASGPRTEDDLLRLQAEWVEHYQARVRAHRLLGISMGTPLDDIEERYRMLCARFPLGDVRREALDAAFQLILATTEASGGGRLDSADAPGGHSATLASVGVPAVTSAEFSDEDGHDPLASSEDDASDPS